MLPTVGPVEADQSGMWLLHYYMLEGGVELVGAAGLVVATGSVLLFLFV